MSRPEVAHLIVGPFGIGKTELLGAIGERLSSNRCTVLRVAVPPGPGHAEPTVQELHPFRQCLAIARQVADQLATVGETKLSRSIGVLVRRAQFNPITINQSITAADQALVLANGAQSVQLHWGEHLALMEDLLGDEVVSALTQRKRRFTIAMLVDDLHHLAGTRGELWLLDVLRRSRGMRVVATQRPVSISPALARAFSAHQLGPLPREDVAAHLRQRLPDATDGLVDLVCTATGRLPWGVGFVAERLSHTRDDAQHFQKELLELANVSADLVELVDMFLARLPRDLRDGLDRLSVLREFDERAAVHLLAADSDPTSSSSEGEKRRWVALLGELRQALVVETTRRDEPGPTRSSDPATINVCMHVPDIVRAVVASQLLLRDPYQVAALHRGAADFYCSAIERTGADLSDPFAHWSAIEGGINQRYLAEWIYHVANAAGTLRREERTKIVRWYFEGLFWYEWKVPHWFCQRLLGYCDAIRRTNASVDWLDCLHRLHEHYPRGWRKETDAVTWQLVIDALMQLRGYVRQPGSPPAEPTDGSQTYALITHMLAEALYFARANPDTAADRYLEAARWYVGDANDWCRTYVRLHLAELELRRGDPTMARAESGILLATAKGYEDIELFCHTLLLRADERWISGQRIESVATSLLSVLHALTYQVRQLYLQQMVHFPDAYTREVYEETVARAADRLNDLRRLSPDAGAVARQAATALFAPFWDYDGAARAGVFPPAPTDADLGWPESGYVRRVRWLVEEREALLWNLDLGCSALGLKGL